MFKHLAKDLPASIVVFFVALPLCLGIAVASDAPPFAGLIAGIIGGIVVGAISGSQVGVSGPAAGLAAIVLAAIASLGYEKFLVAVVLGGVIQIVFGIARAGVIGYYFPSSVIKGMLTGIGIIIILKQIPHFFGVDKDPNGDFSFIQPDGENTFTEILNIAGSIGWGSTIIAVIALLVLILWSEFLSKKGKLFTLIQGPLVAVVLGIVFYALTTGSSLEISDLHLVDVPVPDSFESFKGQFIFPDFSVIWLPEIWITAFTIALVASLETLLCVEATDKLDPEKRITPTNRELYAQGTGNILSGLIGGIPITQVIVRSSANIQSGGKTKMSAIFHGFLLLISVVAIPVVLNMIPLSVLAAVLFVVGYKLAKPSTFKAMWDAGLKQFVPFIVTVIIIVFKDLLWGIGIGLVLGIIMTLYQSYKNSHFLHKEDPDHGGPKVRMTLAEEVTFFNKAAVKRELDELPEGTQLELNITKTTYMDYDIIEILQDFKQKAESRNIDITLVSQRGTLKNPENYFQFFKQEKIYPLKKHNQVS
ncbi:Sulfate permease, MFS superfamily [Nonlabens sp. Hel1_33_55]|uniref:SulP family inorganic anion transporter n=1 Tax=Nonlabens sp. Hel1_33_55 TaxID=1336802 RepID=UPI000875E91E|nr:SulP family inorganic anion transporter [Nonlabens sp. Hel1_33_55]SCY32118.1 Sulfate permease, MFS superfamily [Nonlabens sp. Hel1_33_55]